LKTNIIKLTHTRSVQLIGQTRARRKCLSSRLLLASEHGRLVERVQKGESAAFNRSEIHSQDFTFQSESHFPTIHNPSSASSMPLQPWDG